MAKNRKTFGEEVFNPVAREDNIYTTNQNLNNNQSESKLSVDSDRKFRLWK